MTILIFIAGLLLLIIGADLLVRGASRLAAALGIPSLIIGLTVVAFGTSAPEFAVSIQAALAGQSTVGVGNVIGSNIFNVLFILGVSASIAPLLVSQQLIRIDVPLMIGASVVVLAMAWDNSFSRYDGLLLFAGIIVYICFLIYYGRKDGQPLEGDLTSLDEKTSTYWMMNILFVIGDLILLVLGSNWLVDSAIAIAKFLGVSELIIGLTIIAIGTSLPEVVTSIVASIRGERDIAVGNVVGSNLFNLMGVLGLAAIISPDGINVAPSIVAFDIPILVVVAFVCMPIFFTGGVISRWEGGLLLTYYVVYTVYLLLAASHHDSLCVFTYAMTYFVLPLTLITLIVLAVNMYRQEPP